MLHALRERTAFLTQFGKQFKTTGSMVPSSRYLARAITRFLAERGDEPIRVLECGPGTGPFTDQIVQLLRPGDTFDLVELNDQFVQILNQKFERLPSWSEMAEQSTIHQLPLQEFKSEAPYDFIISGLPHINFPEDIVGEIMQSYFSLLKPQGVLSYFEYMYIRPIRTVATLGLDQKRVRAVDKIMEVHCDRYRIQRDQILGNFPPAWVQHLRNTDQSGS